MFGTSYSSSIRRPTEEIIAIFRRHTDKLFDQQQDARQSINEWSSGLIKEISDYAAKQRALVDRFYNERQNYFNSLREQYLASSIYGKNDDMKDIDQLLGKCRNLHVELVQIKFDLRTLQFIEITSVEPPEQIDQEVVNPRVAPNDRYENQSMRSTGTGSAYANDFNSNSFSVPTTSASNRTNQLPTTERMTSFNQSENKNHNDTSTTAFQDDNNTIEKCPMCFMIFPSYMSATSRQFHVNEHCKDE